MRSHLIESDWWVELEWSLVPPAVLILPPLLSGCGFLTLTFVKIKSLQSIWVCLGYHNRIIQTRWLKQKKFISSQFWRLKVHGQGAHTVFSSELSSWLADSYLLTISSHGLFPVMCAPGVFSLTWAPILLEAQMVKSMPVKQKTQVWSLIGKISWRRG